MGREIKFRCWFKNELAQQMLYDERPGDCLVWKNQGQDIEAIMQFTGLHDKNGTPIYEGDIVKVSEEYGGHAYTPLVVDFKDCCFVLRRINYMAEYHPMFNYDFTQIYEVIGNRFENPELLEQTS